MSQIFCWIAIISFINIVYSQQCHNTHPQSVLFSISMNGASVNKIGIAQYLSIINSSANIILPNNPTAGILTFSNSTSIVHSMGLTAYSTVSTAINELLSIDIDENYGNAVSAAMMDAITILTNVTGQKYHVIFSAGNPLNNYGPTTNPIHYNDPCAHGITAKKANIQTYVILIGEQGINFVKEYYSCLVENIEDDIIIIDPISSSSVSAGFSKLASRLCKPSGYDVKITEVNPINQHAAGYMSFIETFNRGGTITVQACWMPMDATPGPYCSGFRTLETGQYFVAYTNATTGTIPSGDQTVGDLPSNPESASSWIAVIEDSNARTLDVVRYGNEANNYTNDNWQQPINGRSFELRGIGYNNDYAGNWRASCYPYTAGSPGSGPSECTSLLNSCSNAAACNANGAPIAAGAGSCATSNYDYCYCPNAYLSDVDTCIKMPVPTECNGYIIPDIGTGYDFMYFAWDRMDWDGYVQYDIVYASSSQISAHFPTGGVSVGAVNDYSLSSGSISITLIMTYRSLIQNAFFTTSKGLTCTISTITPTAQTNIPTSAPSKAPSRYPSVNPAPFTMNPSQSPSESPIEYIATISAETQQSEGELDNLTTLYQYVAGGFLIMFIFIALVSFVDAKLLRRNDYFRIIALGTMMLQTVDMLSDCFFVAGVNIEYKTSLQREYQLILFTSIFCIVVPALLSMLQLYFYAKKHWLNNDYVRSWLSKYATILLLLSLFTGSSFAAVSLLNSYILRLSMFDMGLTDKQLQLFNTKRVYSVVLMENIPQWALQSYYLYLQGTVDNPIAISSIIFSVISIIVSVLNMAIQKSISYTQTYVIISMDITGDCVQAHASKYRTIVRKIKANIAALIGVNEETIEIIKPVYITRGLSLDIHVYIIDSNKDYKSCLIKANQNGTLPELFKNNWKLQGVPIISDIQCQMVISKEQRKSTQQQMMEAQIVQSNALPQTQTEMQNLTIIHKQN